MGLAHPRRGDPLNGRRAAPAATLCFFLSGAAALAYEVLWVRVLSLVFGGTQGALGTVVGVFMLGLALGSALAARWADRVRRPWVWYSLLEGGTALWGLASALSLARLIPLLVAWTVPWFGHPLETLLWRVGMATLLVLPGTFLMGGTLAFVARVSPQGVQGEERGRRGVDPWVGLLYGANTVGAAAGALLAGFFLLPRLGLRGTMATAGVMSLGAALGGAWAGRGKVSREEPPRSLAPPPPGKEGINRGTPPDPRFLAAGALLGGFAAILFEIAWTRVLHLFIGTSVYAVALALGGFLLGVGGGGLLARMVPRGEGSLPGRLRDIQMRVALWGAVVSFALGKFPFFLLKIYARTGGHFALRDFLIFASVATALVLPAAYMGYAFPLLAEAESEASGGVGRGVGTGLALLTLGNLLGAWLTTFLLIPGIGLRGSLLLGVVAAAGAGVLYGRGADRPRRIMRRVAPLVPILLAVLLPGWDPAVMNSGYYLYSLPAPPEDEFPGPTPPPAHLYAGEGGALESSIRARQREVWAPWGGDPPASSFTFLFERDGLSSTVAVVRSEPVGVLTLRIDGKADASTSLPDMRTQVLLGELPMLLSAQGRVLVVGLGAGVTLGSVERHPVSGVDVVEIEPAVVEAARYFSEANGEALDDRRVRIFVDDARHYLTVAPLRYDAIISEPSNLWIGGVANLFTREYFRISRGALSAGGLFCQWIHLYGISLPEIRGVVRTFLESYPDATAWMSSEADLLLVGSPRPGEWHPSLSEIRRRMGDPKVRADLARARIHDPEDLLASLVALPAGLRRFAAEGRVNTDDRPWLEFSTPRSMGRVAGGRILRALVEAGREAGDRADEFFR